MRLFKSSMDGVFYSRDKTISGIVAWPRDTCPQFHLNFKGRGYRFSEGANIGDSESSTLTDPVNKTVKSVWVMKEIMPHYHHPIYSIGFIYGETQYKFKNMKEQEEVLNAMKGFVVSYIFDFYRYRPEYEVDVDVTFSEDLRNALERGEYIDK